MEDLNSGEKPMFFCRGLKRFAVFTGKILIAAIILYWLVSRSGGGFIESLRSFNLYYLLPAASLMLFSLIVNAWRWHMLLKAMHIELSVYESFVLCMKSMFVSLVIPGGGLSSDLIRIAFIVRSAGEGRKMTGAMTVFMDRFTGMLALFILTIFLCAADVPFFLSLKGYLAEFIWLIIFVCFAGIGAAFVLLHHEIFEKIHFVKVMCLAVDRLSRGYYSRVIGSLDAYREHRRSVIVCIISGIFLMHIPNGIAVYFLALGANLDGVSLLSSLSSISLANIAGLIPLTPSGIGARDFVLSGLLDRTGVMNGTAIAVSVIFTSIMILLNLSGAIFFIFGNLSVSKK